MAGKGGAWKVAYADFVTAMMAFFLVMWLISQDQKIKDSIARYFVDPVGFRLAGVSNPNSAGGLFESDHLGPVPGSKIQNSGLGIGNTLGPHAKDSETEAVGEWLLESAARSQEWTEAAQSELSAARQLYGPNERGQEHPQAEAAARRQLAIRMHQSILEQTAANSAELQSDLLIRSLSRVDWNSLADEFLWKARDNSMTFPAPYNFGTPPGQRSQSTTAPEAAPQPTR